jgi:hypothetical protein
VTQNNLRYACFPERRRLALAVGGRVSVYDTTRYRSRAKRPTNPLPRRPRPVETISVVSSGLQAHDNGFISAEEFLAKKTELLRRI